MHPIRALFFSHVRSRDPPNMHDMAGDLLITRANLPLLLLVILSSTAVHGVPLPDPCAGRRIHVRRLPARFNTDLLRHCDGAFPLADHPLATPSCASLANHGLGPRTHNRSRSWYRTDVRLLEPFFHRRLLDRDCLADDPARADAVFLPYYASLDALPFLLDPAMLNFSGAHGAALAQFLATDRPRVLARRHGHDHFLVLAGPAWDYAQPADTDPRLWGTTSLLRRPEFDNFTFLTLESRAWPWQEHAVPHPTSFHPSSLPRLRAWIARARRSRRTALMLYAGTVTRPSRPNIRSFILAECANRTDTCTVVDCHGGSCALDPVRSMRPMLKAKFCLEPPGDTPTRRSTFDAVVAGCVPVFFEDASARTQYGWHLPPERYEEFSVTIPKDAVMLGGVQIMETLAAVPEEEVARMRERLLELAPRVVYRRHGSAAERMREASMDAVDIAVEGTLRRIRGRVRALEDGRPEAMYAMEDDDQEI
ncbi:hypothetical protein CFC21_056077 [Triticum aestivum]|uniref:Exostosin GT47 domain-containing protein n=4 Tax=Triticum TaxID=4564 RepID=A0A9R1GIT8_WHEAT|nr:probable xyloglucan galactosyltransferase GT19 [Triticum aestivum]KAF7047116.1 hypothetical protein CFC21_056077 [Triticum aestivum]